MTIKEKITEHYIKWSLVYGIAGFIVCLGSVCGLESLKANINALTHHHSGASLTLLGLYAIIVFLPSAAAAIYALYIILYATRPKKGLKGVKFKFKNGLTNK